MSFYYLAYILIFSIITKDSSVSSTPKDQSLNIQIKAEIEDKKEPLIQLVDRLNLVLENLKIYLRHDSKRERTKVTKGFFENPTLPSEINLLMNYTSNSTITPTTTTSSTTITKKPKKKRTKKPKTTSTIVTSTTTKKKKKLSTTPTTLGNIFRTTAVNRKVPPKKKVPPESNGPFTTFILNVMDHFIRTEYEEGYAYAWVFNQEVTYNYMYNHTGIWKLGDEFVRLVKGSAKYATTVSASYLQKAIAYVRKFMVIRRQKFTKGFNEALDYVDAIITKDDKRKMESLLRDLNNPEQRRDLFIKDFIYKIVTAPLSRLPDYEVELLQKRITYEIQHSIFNGAFNAYAREGVDDGEGMPEDDGKYKENDLVEEASKDDRLVNDGKKQFVPPDEKKSIFNGFGTILDNVANLF